MEGGHKAGTIKSIKGREPTTGEHTQLQELSDGTILGNFYKASACVCVQNKGVKHHCFEIVK